MTNAVLKESFGFYTSRRTLNDKDKFENIIQFPVTSAAKSNDKSQLGDTIKVDNRLLRSYITEATNGAHMQNKIIEISTKVATLDGKIDNLADVPEKMEKIVENINGISAELSKLNNNVGENFKLLNCMLKERFSRIDTKIEHSDDVREIKFDHVGDKLTTQNRVIWGFGATLLIAIIVAKLI